MTLSCAWAAPIDPATAPSINHALSFTDLSITRNRAARFDGLSFFLSWMMRMMNASVKDIFYDVLIIFFLGYRHS